MTRKAWNRKDALIKAVDAAQRGDVAKVTADSFAEAAKRLAADQLEGWEEAERVSLGAAASFYRASADFDNAVADLLDGFRASSEAARKQAEACEDALLAARTSPVGAPAPRKRASPP